MNHDKRFRSTKATFAVISAFIIWGLLGTVLTPFQVTSYWGVGLGMAAASAYILSLYVQHYGWRKALQMLLMISLVIFGAMILNLYRGWPFGAVTYHDILGWKIFHGLPWPLPLFWTFVLAAMLCLNRPKIVTRDIKILFSWAFDAAIAVMLVDFAVEPILSTTSAQSWSVSGAYLGIPFSSFVGWFLTAFVAGFAAIMLSKPWEIPGQKTPPRHLLLVALGLCLLGLAAATRVSLLIVQALYLAGACFLAVWYYKLHRSDKKISPQPPQEKTVAGN